MPNQANITIIIKATAKITVVIGLILIPIELSSKNLIKPAPPKGIGAVPLLFFLRFDCLCRDDIVHLSQK
jgi:hypothetical protein